MSLQRFLVCHGLIDFDRSVENVTPLERDCTDAKLTAKFDVTADFTSQQRVVFQISLAYDYDGVEDSLLPWQSVDSDAIAEDISEFRAISIVSGTEASVRLRFENRFVMSRIEFRANLWLSNNLAAFRLCEQKNDYAYQYQADYQCARSVLLQNTNDVITKHVHH